jgi:virginiamycin B lyase
VTGVQLGRSFVALVATATCALLAVPVVSGGGSPAAAVGISQTTEYATPGGNPWGTAFDGAGRVWVALPGCDPSPSCSSGTPPGKLARFDPGTNTWGVAVSLPAGYGQPLFVAVDGAGKVWFTMPVTNTIGRYDPTNATVRQWTVPTIASGPWDLVVDSRGRVWFTEHYANKIGRFDPVSATFQEIATPAVNSNPYGITLDAADNVWFTENTDSVALIAQYTTAGVLNEYRIRNTPTAGTGLTPHLIALDPSGNVWWTEGWTHSIGTLNVAAAQPGTNAGVSEYFYSGSHTSGIGIDPHGGAVWFDDSLQNVIGSRPLGGGAFSLFPTPGGHPHDGLNVDAGGRIWYDEEFSNRLAVAVQSGGSPPTTTTTTPSTTTTTPGVGTVLGTDTFARANQLFWGTASDGQAWAGDASSNNAFSIAGGTGRVGATGGSSYNAVLGPSATATDVVVTGAITSYASSNFGAVARWSDGNNWYKAYADPTGLVIQKKVGGLATIVGRAPFVPVDGSAYTLHFRVQGSTLSASIWAAGTAEPASWMLTATDSSLASGRAGLRVLSNNATITITAFQATTAP